ncbi:MAG TPA: hypothetical protein VGJ86_09680 [Acidimicrobiales bacterium]|jgi:hypothetical protein
MSNASDDMVAAAKGSKATATGEAVHEAAREYEKKKKWSGSISRESTRKERTTRRSRVSLSVVVGGGIIVALALWLTQRGDGDPAIKTDDPPATTTSVSTSAPQPTSTTPTTGATPVASGTTCSGVPCTILTAQGTLETPGGEGVWIRSCFDTSPCERRALAAEHQQIYAVCRVEGGMEVFGDTVWVKTPWAFTGPIPQDQPVRAESTGRSDPDSQDFGWATAYYLTPRDAIEALPLCT